MTDPIILDIPITFIPEEVHEQRRIKWCEGHWSELMFALQDRGLSDQIAPTPQALSEKLSNGEGDPCWEACNMINVGAFGTFGANKIINENNGCPVCAFANIVGHVADLVTVSYREPH